MNLPRLSHVSLSPNSTWKIWGNPIFRRYCRSRLRPQGLGIALLISVLIAAFLFCISRATGQYRANLNLVDAERTAFIPLLVFQALVLFILGTAQVAGGMTAESDEGVIDYQRLIPMTPLSKVFGYLFGLPVREYAMVFATLPFTAWVVWRGEIASNVWLPLYLVFFSSALTYHLTGLVAGTVVKNRRWAFLVSMGLVLCLYTVIPQMARFGLVFFKYLTITPVFEECLPGILPQTAASLVATGQSLAPEVKFFNLDFSEMVFTLFSQSGLILTFIMMLYRRWRRTESLLLGKCWATGFFIWVQILLLGNALPLIDSGKVFPTREITRQLKFLRSGWAPESWEAVTISGIYGLVVLLFLWVLIRIITPSSNLQIRAWQRARKQRNTRLSFQSDAATAFGFVLVMALAGAGAWFIFTRAVIESRWFPGHEVPLAVFGFFAIVMLSGGLGFHAMLESKGGKVVGLAVIFIGVVPLMIGAILSVSSNRLMPIASWFFGISPISSPIYASSTLLSIAELPANIARAVPRAFYFWQTISALVTLWLIVQLRRTRKDIAETANTHRPPQS